MIKGLLEKSLKSDIEEFPTKFISKHMPYGHATRTANSCQLSAVSRWPMADSW